MKTPWVHVYFRTNGAHDLLTDVHARWLWTAFERAFPDALIAMLMPNHAHLIVRRSKNVRLRFGAILGRFSLRFRDGLPGWQRIPEPDRIANTRILRRLYRYVALNPCRADLAADPLEWRWSTYRDVFGATAGPWTETGRVAAALDHPIDGFEPSLHHYVSSDTECKVGGTPPPVLPATGDNAPSLDTLYAAAAAALREPVHAAATNRQLRVLFIQAARATPHRTHAIAELAGCSVRTVQRNRQVERDEQALEAVRRCVAEGRFRNP